MRPREPGDLRVLSVITSALVAVAMTLAGIGVLLSMAAYQDAKDFLTRRRT